MSKRNNETKDEYNARMREYMQKRYLETQKWYRQYKVEIGCADCGYNAHHAGLQADHIVERNGDHSKLISRSLARGKNAVLKMLEECEIVCGTCHSIRTFERLEKSMGR